MKIAPNTDCSRRLSISELTGSMPTMEINIQYVDTETPRTPKAIALDHQVIPVIIKAVNSHEKLVTASDAAWDFLNELKISGYPVPTYLVNELEIALKEAKTN